MSQNLLDISLEDLESPVLSGWRDQGRLAFKNLGLPTLKEEDWKYTDIRALLQNQYQAPHICTCHQHKADTTHVRGLPLEAYEIRFHNGRLCCHQPHLPEGITLLSLEEATAEHETGAYLNKSFDMKKRPFAALNTAHLGQGVFVRVEKGFSSDKPLAFVYSFDDTNVVWADLRNILVIENGAKLEWIEFFEGVSPKVYAHNVVNEVFMDKASVLKHYKRQDESRTATHIAFTAVRVRQDACFQSFVLQLGALFSRHEMLVNLVEEGAHAQLNASYYATGQTLHDNTFNVLHKRSKTFSEQLVKGVVKDEAHGVFQGKIRIEKDAVGTQGKQLHRALMLSENAVVDAKPVLEILADDVKCSHGSATGALDENQLFYMRSRGIGQSDARRMLTAAFLNEPFKNIDSPMIYDWLLKDIFK